MEPFRVADHVDSNSYWIGHPNCDGPREELEKFLIDNRNDIVCHVFIDDSEGYEYEYLAVVECQGRWFALYNSGCSCPSPSETWAVTDSAYSKGELVRKIKNRFAGQGFGPTAEEDQMLDELEGLL
jgi:hypothetical protein